MGRLTVVMYRMQCCGCLCSECTIRLSQNALCCNRNWLMGLCMFMVSYLYLVIATGSYFVWTKYPEAHLPSCTLKLKLN